MKNYIFLLVNIIPYSLIGYGVYLINKPMAFICVGALFWADLFIQGLKEAKK